MVRNSLSLLGIVTIALACSPVQETFSNTKVGGSIVDNGGDLITCVASPDNAFEGDYTLDYVATYDPDVGTREDPTGDYEEQLDRLSRLFRAKLPELSRKWEDYKALLESRDQSKPRVWYGRYHGPTDLKDEDIRGQITKNCKEMRGGVLAPNLTQMVDRRYIVDADVPKIHYFYDTDRFQTLKSDLPLQAAYLALHEFLWDFSDNAWVSRSINRFLMTKATEQLSPDEVRRTIRSYGVTGDEDGYIGASMGRMRRLQEKFEANSACDFSRRVLVEFFPTSGKESFDQGESRDYSLVVPRNASEILGPKICGVALTFGYRGNGGSATLQASLKRGNGVHSSSHSAGSSTGDAMFWAMCSDFECVNRQGPLEEVFQPRNTAGSSWMLTAGHGGGSGAAEMIVPYLLFVKLRE